MPQLLSTQQAEGGLCCRTPRAEVFPVHLVFLGTSLQRIESPLQGWGWVRGSSSIPTSHTWLGTLRPPSCPRKSNGTSIPQSHSHPLPKSGGGSPAVQPQTGPISARVQASLSARQDPWQPSQGSLCAEPHPQGCNLKLDMFLGRLGKGRDRTANPISSSISGQDPPALRCFTINLAPPGFAQMFCATVPPVEPGQEPPSSDHGCSAFPKKKDGWETRSSSKRSKSHTFEGCNGRLDGGVPHCMHPQGWPVLPGSMGSATGWVSPVLLLSSLPQGSHQLLRCEITQSSCQFGPQCCGDLPGGVGWHGWASALALGQGGGE